jgi:hypothetical protein
MNRISNIAAALLIRSFLTSGDCCGTLAYDKAAEEPRDVEMDRSLSFHLRRGWMESS